MMIKRRHQRTHAPPQRNPPPALKWLGAGAFHRTEWDHQGRAHYERGLSVAEAKQAIVRMPEMYFTCIRRVCTSLPP